MTQASAGATHWNKPSESRFCGRSAKAIGLSAALVERQLAWASRGRRWHTRWISWGSLGLPSETVPNLRLLVEDFITGDGLLSARPGTASAKSRFSARKITALREKLGLTKAALARQIGINVNTLWRWERGDRKPNGLHRKIIADLMRDAAVGRIWFSSAEPEWSVRS